MLELVSPFICCSVCTQRIPLRIDGQPTWHYDGAKICFASFPGRLMSLGALGLAYRESARRVVPQ